jgi:hypothetical protein
MRAHEHTEAYEGDAEQRVAGLSHPHGCALQSSASNPPQRTTGRGGYLRNRVGSFSARPQSQKVEPFEEVMARACWQRAQRPTRALSASVSGGFESCETTLPPARGSRESGQWQTEALEKLSDPTHGGSFGG